MNNQRFSWCAFVFVIAMSLAGMLVAAQALAQQAGPKAPSSLQD
jgi:hypothetical protein